MSGIQFFTCLFQLLVTVSPGMQCFPDIFQGLRNGSGIFSLFMPLIAGYDCLGQDHPLRVS